MNDPNGVEFLIASKIAMPVANWHYRRTRGYAMRTLALDQSTAQGTLAILDDDKVILERSWTDSRAASRQVYSIISELGTSGMLDLSAIDLFVAGLGPGSFTGMRIAVTAIRAMALPGRKLTRGVSSGRALAWARLTVHEGGEALVAGDARRDRYWLARFTMANGAIRPITQWTLVGRQEAQPWLVPGALFLSPDWDRIPELGAAARAAGMQVVEGPQAATAGDVGRLALLEYRQGLPPEPMEPIYIHPAVFVAPRFV